MNLRKRTLALLLTVCLLLSVMVPMVSAVTYTKITFGSTYSTNWEYIAASSEAAKGVATCAKSYLTMNFTSTMAKNDDWIAIRVKGASQGNYHLTLQPKTNSSCGLADIYVLPDSSLTAYSAELTSYVASGMTASTYQGVFDSNTAATSLQDLGHVSLTGDSFILVVKPLIEQPTSKWRCYINAVNLIPDQTAADADSLATVLTDIADTAGSRFVTVKLTGNIQADNITVPKNVTLDLNGNTLSGTGITFNGKLADSADGRGLYKSQITTIASDDLLLYDEEEAGYRVYNNYTVAPHGKALQTIDSNTKKLWINVSFANPDAYRVIKNGISGISIGAALSWTPDGGTATTANLVFDGDVVADWAAKMEAGKNVGFYIQFTGFDNLAAGKLKLTPFVNEVSSATSISYTKAAG